MVIFNHSFESGKKVIVQAIRVFGSFFFIMYTVLSLGCVYKRSEQKNYHIGIISRADSIWKKGDGIKPIEISYYAMTLNDSVRRIFPELFKPQEINLILALNRFDLAELWRVDTLVIPDTFLADLRLYSPFPDTLPKLKQVHKILFISHYAQAFAAYENGNQIRWGPVSLGKQSTPTPVGLFFTNWKSKQRVSTIDEDIEVVFQH